jgi:hypothetical protein
MGSSSRQAAVNVAANAEAETQIASQSEQITSLMREVKLRVCLGATLVPAGAES